MRDGSLQPDAWTLAGAPSGSFAVLEPIADGFRHYQKNRYAVSAESCGEQAQLMT